MRKLLSQCSSYYVGWLAGQARARHCLREIHYLRKTQLSDVLR